MRAAILEVLRECGPYATLQIIYAAVHAKLDPLGWTEQPLGTPKFQKQIRNEIGRMVAAKLLTHLGRGSYALPPD